MRIQVVLSFFAILFIFSIHRGFAIIEYDVNDTLYVWAGNGLNLRAAPHTSAKIIGKIPFTDFVICQSSKTEVDYLKQAEYVADKVTISPEKTNILDLHGNWAKVIFDGKTGYVFDAYLSKLSPVALPEQERSLLDFFATIEQPTYILKKEALDEFGEDKILFSNGAYMKQCYYPAGFSYRIMIPDFTKEEAFLLIRYIDDKATGVLRKNQGDIIIQQSESSYKIKQLGSMVMVCMQ